MKLYITAALIAVIALHQFSSKDPSSFRSPEWSKYRESCVEGIAAIYSEYRQDKDSDQGRFHTHPGPWTEEREFQKACTAKADALFLDK